VTAISIHNFGQCIFERNKTEQLLRVKYGSEWKRIRRDPRSNRDRRTLHESQCVPIRDERKNLTDRRDPRRLTCGECGKDFSDVRSMADHYPCKASHELEYRALIGHLKLWELQKSSKSRSINDAGWSSLVARRAHKTPCHAWPCWIQTT